MDLSTPPSVPTQLIAVHHRNGTVAGYGRELECPYCGLRHGHGADIGHRQAHCASAVPGSRHRIVDPRDTRETPGYVLCEPDEDINWVAEKVRATLIVLHNRYRRLCAEREELTVVSARDARVKRLLADQADEIGAVLRKAGVSL